MWKDVDLLAKKCRTGQQTQMNKEANCSFFLVKKSYLKNVKAIVKISFVPSGIKKYR